MSDLKHQTVSELILTKARTEELIASLKSQIAGQNSRLEWINHYLFEKTPQEMSAPLYHFRWKINGIVPTK